MNAPSTAGRQRGSATILVVTLLLVAVALISLYTTRSTVMEQRLSANELRYTQALVTAEYGVEQGLAYLVHHRAVMGSGWGALGLWHECSGIALPCGDGTTAYYDADWLYTGPLPNQRTPADPAQTVQTWLLTPNVGALPDAYPLVHVVARGRADNGSATVLLRRAFQGIGLFINTVPSPLTVAGNTELSGNYHVWGNANGRGPSMVLSTWSGGDVNIGGNAKTYDVADPASVYPNKQSNGAVVLSHKDFQGPDVVDNSPSFPDDLFYYLFGVARSDAQQLKDMAEVHSGCSSLGPQSRGLVWVTGNCHVTSTDIGSADHPAALIIEGAVAQSGNSAIYGLLFVMDTAPSVSMQGTLTVHGAMLVDQNVDLGSGTFLLHYDAGTLAGLNDQSGRFAYIEGTWNDDY